jgi:hypothetical protein
MVSREFVDFRVARVDGWVEDWQGDWRLEVLSFGKNQSQEFWHLGNSSLVAEWPWSTVASKKLGTVTLSSITFKLFDRSKWFFCDLTVLKQLMIHREDIHDIVQPGLREVRGLSLLVIHPRIKPKIHSNSPSKLQATFNQLSTEKPLQSSRKCSQLPKLPYQ